MRYILFATLLSLSACDGAPGAPPPKIAAPQREALDKAKGVDQVLQKSNDESQKKISEAEGK